MIGGSYSPATTLIKRIDGKNWAFSEQIEGGSAMFLQYTLERFEIVPNDDPLPTATIPDIVLQYNTTNLQNKQFYQKDNGL